MNRERIGVLTIGQTPRPDLTTPLAHLAQHYDLLLRGALDQLTLQDVMRAKPGRYPLITQMRNGNQVTVDEAFLTPLLQMAISQLEQENVTASLLLCAGPFQALTSTRPLIRPFGLAVQILNTLGSQYLGVLVPTDDQRQPAAQKWKAAGFTPRIWSLEHQSMDEWLQTEPVQNQDLSALVFDYVGYPIETVRRLQALFPVPVLDLGHLSIATLEAILSRAVHTSEM